MNADNDKLTEANPHRSGYPLFALFFAIAAAAILVSLSAPVVSLVNADQVSAGEFAISSVSVGGVGMLIGFFIGLYHYRRVFGASLGVLGGATIGAIVGPVVLSPHYDQIMATSLGGSLLLLVMGIVCRMIDQPSDRRAADPNKSC